MILGTFSILHPYVLGNFDIQYLTRYLELDLYPLILWMMIMNVYAGAMVFENNRGLKRRSREGGWRADTRDTDEAGGAGVWYICGLEIWDQEDVASHL